MDAIAALDGEWRQTSVSNLDEFLAAQGMPWLMRKAAAQFTLTQVIRLELATGMITIETGGLPKAVAFPPVTAGLGIEPTVVVHDGKPVCVRVNLQDHVLVATCTSDSEPEAVFRRELVSLNQMKMTIRQRGVTYERLFKRTSATPNEVASTLPMRKAAGANWPSLVKAKAVVDPITSDSKEEEPSLFCGIAGCVGSCE